MRTCTVAVTAMGKTTYIYLSQDANPSNQLQSQKLMQKDSVLYLTMNV